MPFCRVDPCWPPRVALPPRKTSARAGHDATDARNRPSNHAAFRKRERGSEKGSNADTGEIDAAV